VLTGNFFIEKKKKKKKKKKTPRPPPPPPTHTHNFFFDFQAALHFTLSLCLYDGAFSYVYVAHQSALCDLFDTGPARVRANSAAAAGAFLASLPVLLVSHVSAPVPGAVPVAACAALAAVTAVGLRASAAVLVGVEVARGGPKKHTPTDTGSVVGAALLPVAAARKDPDAAATTTTTINLTPLPGAAATAESTAAAAASLTSATTTVDAVEYEAPSFVAILRALLRSQDFAVFTVFNALQTFACNLLTSAFPVLVAHLVTGSLGVTGASAILWLSFALPHVITVLLAGPASRLGAHKVIGTITWLRAISTVVFFIVTAVFVSGGTQVQPAAAWLTPPTIPQAGAEAPVIEAATTAQEPGLLPSLASAAAAAAPAPVWCAVWLGVSLLAVRLMTEAVCRLSSLVIADLVDAEEAQRRADDGGRIGGLAIRSVAGAVQGVQVMLTRPAQTLAPVLTWWFLSRAGISRTDISATPDAALPLYSAALFASGGVAAAQVIVWARYKLRDGKLKALGEKLRSLRGIAVKV
jgi:hypothetical protein